MHSFSRNVKDPAAYREQCAAAATARVGINVPAQEAEDYDVTEENLTTPAAAALLAEGGTCPLYVASQVGQPKLISLQHSVSQIPGNSSAHLSLLCYLLNSIKPAGGGPTHYCPFSP